MVGLDQQRGCSLLLGPCWPIETWSRAKDHDDTWSACRIWSLLGAELLWSLVVDALRGSGDEAVVLVVVVSASLSPHGRKSHDFLIGESDSLVTP